MTDRPVFENVNTTRLMVPGSPSGNAYEEARCEKIARNRQRMLHLGVLVTHRQLFPCNAASLKRKPAAKKGVSAQQQRCSSSLVVVPKRNYREASPAKRGQLLLTTRGRMSITAKVSKVKQSAKVEQQDPLAGSAAIFGFTKEGDEWTHHKWSTLTDKGKPYLLQCSTITLIRLWYCCSIDLEELRGQPDKSFKRITDALSQEPLGMLNDVLTRVEGLMGKQY